MSLDSRVASSEEMKIPVPDELDGLVVKVREGVLLNTADVFISSLLVKKKSCNFQDDACNIVKPYHSPTPPKFNIVPEKWWLDDYFPIEKGTFQWLC